MNIPHSQIESTEQSVKAEATLKAFLKLSVDLFRISEQQGYFQQLNQAWEKTLGWSISELQSQPWIEFVHPNDQEATLAAERRCLQEEFVEYEHRYCHKDGSYRWLSWRVSHHEDGFFYGVAKDITTTKQAEAALNYRLELERLITTISAKFINLSSKKIDGEINKTLQVIGEFAGFDRGYLVLFSEDGCWSHLAYEWHTPSIESLSREWQTFSSESLPWCRAKLINFEIVQVSRREELPPEAFNLKHRMQSVGTQSLVCIPLINGQSLMGYMGFAAIEEKRILSPEISALVKIVAEICVNVLLRQQAEAKLRDSERLFHAVFNQTFQFASILKPDGTIVEDNQTAMDFCQLTREELVGLPFWELKCWTISSETQNFLKKAITEAAADKIVRYEADILSPGNTVITIDFSLKPVNNETGEVLFLIAEGRDITERKQAELILREREERLRLHVDNSPLAIMEWDQEFRLRRWSKRAEKIFGWQAQEVLNKNPREWQFVCEEDAEMVDTILHRLIERNCHYTVDENRNYTKDGSVVYCQWYNSAVCDDSGNLVSILSLVQDVTERKQAEIALQQAMNELETRVQQRTTQLEQANQQLSAKVVQHQQVEEALRHSEEQFRQVFDEAPIGMSLTSLDDHYIRVNRAFFEMLGYSQSELMAVNFRDITHPEDLEKELPALGKIRTGEIDNFKLEKRYLKKNQEILWVNLTLMALRDEAGEILCDLAMVEDITERKQAEEALRQSEARYRAIVEVQTELICRFNTEEILTFVNDAYCRYFGKQHSELIGHNFIPNIPPEDQEIVTQAISDLSPEQPITTYEHRVILPSEQTRWQQWTNRGMFDHQGNLIEYQAVGRDITELKQAEAEIRKALARARELSELRSGFVSLVSHEFRTPLTTILSSAQLLERYTHRLSEEKQHNHHQRIQGAVNRMTQLLDEVLTIGKAEAGKLTCNPEPIDLVTFCADVTESMQISVTSQSQINFNVLGEIPKAQVDDKLLGHILTNVLSNALKYSPGGGTVELELSSTSDLAVFRIQDNGIGIPQKDLGQLFESFRRASNVGTIQGTGLGLAIVKKCVDLHGGEINIESEIGVGTTFTIKLPLNYQPSTQVLPISE
ncbi:PAS domain S-box protein [Lyngbya aestuarii]|uniref:PAS domain S-box protein n=1 Tax=Lyngbya aestuarii TaxID=118322 RepID=UPI00403E1BBF